MSAADQRLQKQSLGFATTILLATLAIIAFAGNSVIARYALGGGLIDPGSYSVIRLASGALVLLPLLIGRKPAWDWRGGLALLCYVAAFSWAYVALPAALGALILFACVQATIMITGLVRGERVGPLGIAGLLLSLLGLGVLMVPGMAGGALTPAAMMALSGIAWGAYTMLGRRSGDAAQFTATSFVIGSVLALPLLALAPQMPAMSGIGLAVLSGAVTSGAGYVVWNKVSPMLGLATLATVQLATPVVAGIGGVILLGEVITMALAGAGALIIMGIVLTLKR